MEMTPHSRLDLEAMADAERHLEGCFDAARLNARLAGPLDRDTAEGEVRYWLDFQRLENDEVGMTGRLEARLKARCQRCLELFDLPVETSFRIQATCDRGSAEPQTGWELGDDDSSPTLGGLIEDELLLATAVFPAPPGGGLPVGRGHRAQRRG